MRRKILLLGSLLGMLFFSFNPVSALTLKQKEGKLLIENPYYRATILPNKGARITSLILKETGNEFTRGGGIAEEVIGRSYAGGLGKVAYTYKIAEKSPSLLKIEFTCMEDTPKLKGMLYKKTFTFSESTPLIKVDLSLFQEESANRISDFRIHNYVIAGRSVDSNDVYFIPTTAGLKEVSCKSKPWESYTKDFTVGLAGVMDKKSGDSLIFLFDYDSTRVPFFWLGGEGTSSTIEWFYRDFILEEGDTWKSSYSILPITLSSLSNLQVSLKKYGLDINTSLRVKRPQKPLNITLAKRGKLEKQEKKKENLSILWVGNRGCIYQLCRVYRIEDALATISPKPEVTFCELLQKEGGGRGKTDYFDKNYPVSLRGLSKYDVIIFLDIPHWTFKENDEANLISYIKLGGRVVFAGDHGRGYKGTKLSEIIPLNVDYSKEEKCYAQFSTQIKDRSGWEKVEFTDTGSSVTRGIPDVDLTKIIVHKTTAKAGSKTLMKAAGKYPLLVIRSLGKGRVVSFPIVASEGWLGYSVHFNYRNWDNALFTYSFYDDLWRNLIAYLTDKSPEVSFASFNGPSNLSEIITSDKHNISGTIRNNGDNVQKGKISFELKNNRLDKSSPYKKSISYSLSPGKERRFSFPLQLSPLQANYTYTVSIKDKKNNLVDKRDSFFFAHPVPCIKLSLKKENNWSNVFGRNMEIDYKIDVAGTDKSRELSLKTSLVDSSGKALAQLPAVAVTSEIQSLSLGNLAKGEYKVQVELLDKNRVIDRAQERIFIVPYPDEEDFYVIQARGGGTLYGASTLENRDKEIKKMVSLGFNRISTSRTSRDSYFAVYEGHAAAEAQKLGMSLGCKGGAPSRDFGLYQKYPSVFYSPEEVLKKKDKITRTLKASQKLFSKDPRASDYYYLQDEPSLFTTGPLRKDAQQWCNAAFKKKYGYDFPEHPDDKNYYYGYKFVAENMVECLKDMNKMCKSIDPSYKSMMGISACYVLGTAGIDQVGTVTNLDLAVTSSYQMGTWENRFALDSLWGASDFKDNIGLVGSISITCSGILYPEHMGNQVYNGLAHNCKGYYPFPWRVATWYGAEDPDRCLMMQKANGELKQVGPLFLHLRKERAKTGILQPWCTYVLTGRGGKKGYPYSYRQLMPPYAWFHEEFGHVDLLYESQVEKEKFINDYKLFLIPKMTEYLPTPIYKELKNYVRQGGTLIAVTSYPTRNERREPDTTLSELFSAKAGKFSTLIPIKAKVLYRNRAGEPVATVNTYGKGKAVLLGFHPLHEGPFPLLGEIAKSLNIDTLVSKSDTLDTEANLFSDKYQGKYLVAVNYKREEKKITALVNLPEKTYYTYNLLTGEKLKTYYKDNKLNIPITLSSLWGKAIAILPSAPEKLSVSLDKKNFSPGDNLSYKIELLSKGRKVNYSLPVNIRVIDSKGKDRSDEYAGIHTLKGGVYTKKIVFADNDPKGTWRIEVETPINKIKRIEKFIVR